MNYFILLSLIFIILPFNEIISQNLCGSINNQITVIPTDGNIKALAIFIKFRDDNSEHSDWDLSTYEFSRPPWTENMLMISPDESPVHPSISGYFKNASINLCKIYGKTFPNINASPNVYITERNINYYKGEECGGTRGINSTVYEALKNLDNVIDYSEYDNFLLNGLQGHDGIVDFITVFFRDIHVGITDCDTYDGIACLSGGYNYFRDENDLIKDSYLTNDFLNGQRIQVNRSSGCIINLYSPRKIDIAAHEISHLMGLYYHNIIGHTGVWSLSEAVTGVGLPNIFERGQLNWLPSNYDLYISGPGIYDDIILKDYETGEGLINITLNMGILQLVQVLPVIR